MRRPLLPAVTIFLALLASGTALCPPAARAQQGQELMAEYLPTKLTGWTAGALVPADPPLPLYTVFHAQRSYSRDGVTVIVAAARSKALTDAIRGSIVRPATLPPATRIDTLAGRKVLIGESKSGLTVQALSGPTDVVMLTTSGGTLKDVADLLSAVPISDARR